MPIEGPLSTAVPQFFPAQWLRETPDIVFSEFPSRIRVGYIIRTDGAYSYAMQEHLLSAKITLKGLHEVALQNLRRLPSPGLTVANTPGGNEAWLPDVEDNFVAARILLPEMQREVSKALGLPFLAVLPCRDFAICWSEKQDESFQARNRSEALRIFEEDDYNLTPDILRFDGQAFHLVAEQRVDA